MIKLAFEIPIKYLRMFSKMTDYDYVLAHLWNNVDYREFYIEQQKKGRFIILDNSAFELDNCLVNDELGCIIEDLKPNCVVAPDVRGNSELTQQKTSEFITYVTEKKFKMEIMGVVQGKNLEEWLACYHFMTTHPLINRIGLTFEYYFGVPEEVTRKNLTQQWMERRIKLIEYLVKVGVIPENKKFHLLGASDCVEYRFVKKYSFIETADTSSPVLHGVNDIAYKDYGLSCEKIAERLDFGCSLVKKQINLINKNIQIVKRFSR